MAQTPVNLEKEMTSRGIYPIEGTYYGAPYPEVEQLTPSITPRENLLRYLRGEDYEWIPDATADILDITPHCIPDVDACDYEGGYDTFGVKWIPVTGGQLPSFVEPGFVVLKDVADWDKLPWPNVESWPWAEYAARYDEAYKNDDRARRGVVLSSYFERLIAVMGFEEAAMAMLEDPESVEAFFTKLTEMNLSIMRHYIDDFHCDMILIHDDWSAQRAPFFAPDIASELIAPQIRRLTDYAHSRGVLFTFHSCGNGERMIPAMKETGADTWQAQYSAIDAPACYEACGDDLVLESYPPVPWVKGKELEDALREVYVKACTKHRALLNFFEYDPENMFELRRAAYKVGRELAAQGVCC